MHYRIYPSFFMLQYLFSPMITWSTTGMSIILPDLTSLWVMEISCLLGSGSPLGWLWTRMIDAQGYLRVSAKTSRGCTMAADIEPMEIVGVARSWCFMLNRAIMKCSLHSCMSKGAKYFATSSGVLKVGLSRGCSSSMIRRTISFMM